MNSTAKDALTGNIACLAAYLIFGFNIVCCKNIANDGHVSPMSLFLMRSVGATFVAYFLIPVGQKRLKPVLVFAGVDIVNFSPHAHYHAKALHHSI